MIKYDNAYYEFNNENIPQDNTLYCTDVSIQENFRKDTSSIKNIINCGIYDMLIYEDHVKISNNILPFDKLNGHKVNAEALILLKSQKFI
jgi:hypothetical protein